ncbi:MAG TPA: hypothetical protein VGL34_00550 [Steroidobacteraceae bacterium]
MHQETSADLSIDPPNPHKPPLLANVFHASRSGVSSQLPMFPYMDDGDITVSTTVFVGGKGESGVFYHFNTRDEIAVIFGAKGAPIRPGDTFTGAREHSVGGYLEHPEDPDGVVLLTVIQRQSEPGVEQSEAMSWLCSACQAVLQKQSYPGKPSMERPPGFSPPQQSVLEAAKVIGAFNADAAERTCKSCGHLNEPFPVHVWGWNNYAANYFSAESARRQFLAAASREDR